MNGLPSNEVYSFLQDDQGFLWLATGDGISRYDGFSFQPFYSNSQTSRAGSVIRQDRYGRIWYENFDGNIYYTHGGGLKALPQHKSTGYIPYGITNDYLFAMQASCINVYRLQDLALVRSIPVSYSAAISSASDEHHFYILLDNDLYGIDDRMVLRKYSFSGSGADAYKAGSLVFINGKLHLYSRNNQAKALFVMDAAGKISRGIDLPVTTAIQHVSFIDGHYWVLTSAGAFSFDAHGKNDYGNTPLFGGKSISSVIKDRQGNYWFATTDEGLLLVPDLDNDMISTGTHQPYKIVSTPDGFIIGTRKGKLLFADKDFQRIKPGPDNKHHTMVNMLYYDVRRDHIFLYASSYTELFSADGLKPNQAFQFAAKDIRSLDNKYYAFAASGIAGLIKIPGVHSHTPSLWDFCFSRFYDSTNPGIAAFFKGGRAKSVAVSDNDSSLFFATGDGLFTVDFKGSITEILAEGRHMYLQQLFTLNHTLYALSSKGNLYRKEHGKEPELLHKTWNLLPGSIKSIRVSSGTLLILAEDGMYFAEQDADGRMRLQQAGSGINAYEINDFIRDGDRLILLSNKGIIRMKLKAKLRQGRGPLFVLNRFLVNNEEVGNISGHTFPYDDNNITVHFSLLDFGSGTRTPVAYKLNNGQWKMIPAETRTVTFPALSPGRYKLSFRWGDHSTEDRPVVFTIKPPFWLTWWFISGVVLSLVAIGYLYYRSRIRTLESKSRLLQEKTELEKDLSRSMLTSIKAQMNPHFFYNALNTIQAFIFTDDRRRASGYLSKFSKLTRMILEMSECELITLEEELKALELYLDLEKMRFGDEFTFVIARDNQMDESYICIPPMIIQPYVENAIKHGLLHKQGDKQLRMEFAQTGNLLTVIIDDNGIGRKKAMEHNSRKDGLHRSFASQANGKRLELLNKGSGTQLGVEILDKRDEYGNDTGTRVILTIPLN